MGIDFLDITFRIEKTYGLKLERDWGKYVIVPPLDETGVAVSGADVPVRKIVELICERIGATKTGFETLVRRRQEVGQALHECFDIDAAVLSPDLQLDDLIPTENRHKRWSQLGQRLGQTLPGLERPVVLSWLLTGIGAAIFLVALANWPDWLRSNRNPAMLALDDSRLILKILGGCWGILWFCTRSDCVPRACRTIDHLVQHVTTDEVLLSTIRIREAAKTSLPAPHVWTDEAVYFALQTILMGALSVERNEITLDSRLFQDLGCS